MASLLPTELSFYLGSQADALSSTILSPDSQPPPKSRPSKKITAVSSLVSATSLDRQPSSAANPEKSVFAAACSAEPQAPPKEYSPRGAKLSALVALVDTGRSPSAHDQRSTAQGGFRLSFFFFFFICIATWDIFLLKSLVLWSRSNLDRLPAPDFCCCKIK